MIWNQVLSLNQPDWLWWKTIEILHSASLSVVRNILEKQEKGNLSDCGCTCLSASLLLMCNKIRHIWLYKVCMHIETAKCTNLNWTDYHLIPQWTRFWGFQTSTCKFWYLISMKFVLDINLKMPTKVGILKCMTRTNLNATLSAILRKKCLVCVWCYENF